MKWILWISIALVGVLILITLIGWLLPKAHSVSREVQFREPPEAIWKAITDIEAMPVAPRLEKRQTSSRQKRIAFLGRDLRLRNDSV
jgi:hypothetical protein